MSDNHELLLDKPDPDFEVFWPVLKGAWFRALERRATELVDDAVDLSVFNSLELPIIGTKEMVYMRSQYEELEKLDTHNIANVARTEVPDSFWFPGRIAVRGLVVKRKLDADMGEGQLCLIVNDHRWRIHRAFFVSLIERLTGNRQELWRQKKRGPTIKLGRVNRFIEPAVLKSIFGPLGSQGVPVEPGKILPEAKD